MPESIANDMGNSPLVDPPNSPPGGNFVKLATINTTSAIHISTFLENTKKCLARAKYKRVQDLPHFGKPHFHPVGLVGGGHSLKKKENIDDLKRFYARNTIIACGSSHDWCYDNGTPPNFCVVCDPDPIAANYLKKHSSFTKYLIASSCDPVVFDILEGEDIYIWHNHSDEEGYYDKLKEIDPNYVFTVGGGCTVGLRTLVLSIYIGYKEQHFFGFDSCLGEDDVRYAYPLSTDREQLGNIYKIRFGFRDSPSSKEYRCEGYHLAQAEHFKCLYESHNDKFTPVFHGDGLLKDVLEAIHREKERVEVEKLGDKHE